MTTPDRDSLSKGLVSIGEEAVAKSNGALFYDYFTRAVSSRRAARSPASHPRPAGHRRPPDPFHRAHRRTDG